MGKYGKHDSARDPIALWDSLLDDVAEQAAEDRVPTKDDISWSQEVDAMVQRRLAALRGQLTPVHATATQSVMIPAEIQALSRDGLLARLEILRQGASVRYAHQDLTGLSDDDLRTMLALLVAPTGR